MYYIEITLYVCLGSVQIASMGELSIQLAASVRGIIEGNNCYDRFCRWVPLKCQRAFIYGTSMLMCALSISLMIKGVVFWSDIGHKTLIQSNE